MEFSKLLATIKSEPGSCQLHVPEAWTQGRSIFGGLQAVLAVKGMRTLVPSHMPLRSLQTTFVAPVSQGLVQVQAKLLRAGKNTIQVEARIVQGEQTQCLVVGVFGLARESALSLSPVRENLSDSPQGISLPFIPGLMPSYLQHFDGCWVRGGLPFSGTGEPKASLVVSFLDSGPVTEDHVIAIGDFLPPIAMSYLTAPVPGSSISWMFELLTENFSGISLENWQIDGDFQAAREGYVSESSVIWASNGQVVALSRQCRAIFG